MNIQTKKHGRSRAVLLVMLVVTAMMLLSGCRSTGEPVITETAENTFGKTLVVATDDNYWPYVYYDEAGRLTGHDIELITIVANALNMNLEIRPMTWAESLDAVRNGEADAVLTCEYTGRDVDDGIITTSPVKSDDFVVFSREKISSIDELYGKYIGVMKNGNVVKSIVEHGLEDRCIYYDSNLDAFQALSEGKCDCVIVRYIIGLGIIKEMGNAANGIDGYVSLSGSRSCIGVSVDNRPLANEISGVIGNLRADGTLESLNEKWIQAHYPEHTFQGFVRKYQTAILLASALLVLIIALIFIIQRRNYSKVISVEKAYSKDLERAKSEAEAANVAKSTFLFNMSHDIRTPINAIKGFTDIAVKNIDDREKAMDSLTKVQESCNVLVELVSNILDMSRIESGKATIRENSVNINEIFTDIRPMLEEQAKGKNIALDFHISDIRDAQVLCDVVHTHQILVNLITNAIKYTPDGGSVRVTVKQLDGNADGRGSYEFTVKDNGYGMSPAYQKVAFEMFSREENSTISGIQGTGLGLPLCKKISEMMGGSIRMESEQGLGSTFTVVLPLTAVAEEETAEPAEQAEAVCISFQEKKILLVEDNELNREIATDILEEEDIIVETAEDGRVAVEKMKQNGPDYYDCILMDIQMPYMNGYEATKAIRSMYPDAKLPIIALSANAFEEDKQKSLEAGMNAHIAKPINVPELMKTLSELMK